MASERDYETVKMSTVISCISEIRTITCCLRALVAGLLLVVEVLVIDDRDLRGGGGGHDLRDRLDGLERRC